MSNEIITLMETHIILTYLNCLLIIMLVFKTKMIDVSIVTEKTSMSQTIYAYRIHINGYTIRIPIRNEHKVRLAEDIDHMLSISESGRRQQLGAIFSWLKTWDEVKQFQKDYSVVDLKYVEELVSEYIRKQTWQ